MYPASKEPLACDSPTQAGLGRAARGRWRGSSRHLRSVRVPGSVVVGLLSAGSASPAVAADTCANAAVRAQNSSTGLPDCRAYEMVSSPYKEGFRVRANFLRFTDDGVVSYGRSARLPATEGLLQQSVSRDAVGGGLGDERGGAARCDLRQLENTVQAESADLRWSLWVMSRRLCQETSTRYYLRGPDGVFKRVGDAESPL